jgi:hypothetical protein
VAAVVLLGLAGCGDGATAPSEWTPPEIAPPVRAISDAFNDGNPHFYFLPPVVPSPTPSGTFDGSLSPRVEICESDLTTCTETPFAVFMFGEEPGDVRVVPEDEHYILNWHARDWELEAGAYYRITVFQASFELGYVDVLIDGQGGGKNAETGDAFQLKDGRTLPLKIRIEEGAASMAHASASTPDGAAAVHAPPGSLQDYEELTVEPVETTAELPDDGSALPGTVYDFGPDGLEFEEPVELTLAYDPATLPMGVVENGLRVYVAGPDGWELLPGGAVDLTTNKVTGLTTHFSSFAILPGRAQKCQGSGYGTLEGALADIGPEGTITVCDGTHSVEGVVVDKPVTIRAEAGATPVFETSTELAALWVDGYAAGTVVIDGLTFDFATPDGGPAARSYAIRVHNTYDQLFIQNSTFNIDPAARGSVSLSSSSVATAAAFIDEVEINGGVFGVASIDVQVDVTNSSISGTSIGVSHSAPGGGNEGGRIESNTFADCGSRCVRPTNGADVDVISNAFGECGSLRCVSVGGGATVDVMGNTFAAPTLTGDGVPDQNNIILIHRSTGVIDGNTFEGCAFYDCIEAFGTGATATITNNEFTHVAGQSEWDFSDIILANDSATVTSENNVLHSCGVMCYKVLDGASMTVRNETVSTPTGHGTQWIVNAASDDPTTGPNTLVFEDNAVTGSGAEIGAVLFHPTAGTVNRNTFSGLTDGFELHNGSTLTGQDNVLGLSGVGLRIFDGVADFRFNDLTGQATGIEGAGDGASDLTCNWWGDAAGPQNVDAGTPSSVYEPWATAPIANGAGGACDGGPPNDVAVDPAAADGVTTFATLEGAMEAVAPGGRVGVADGTHVLASDLWVNKPVLIEGNGPGKPTIDGTSTFAAFIIQSDGDMTLRNLHVLGGEIAVNIRQYSPEDPYDNVRIENVDIDVMAGKEGITAWVGSPPDGRRIEIVGGTITGGARGISIHDGGHELFVNGVTLTGQTDGFAAAIDFGVAVSGVIDGNTLNGCSNACISVGGNDPTQGSTLIRNNLLYVDATVFTAEAIRVWGGSVQVLNNHIEGQGGTNDPADPNTWAIHSSAVLVANTGSLEISGNNIFNAFRALIFESQVGTVTGSDNVVDNSSTGIEVDDVASLSLNYSDFTDVAGNWIGDPDADVTCNWWGDPANLPVGAYDPSAYTPWATAPIANGAGGACDGGL